MMTALCAARNIAVELETRSLWSVNTDAEYHEGTSVRRRR